MIEDAKTVLSIEQPFFFRRIGVPPVYFHFHFANGIYFLIYVIINKKEILSEIIIYFKALGMLEREVGVKEEV